MADETEQDPALVERKLVTILSADVAEYSRLMAEDEEGTLRTFRDYTKTFRALVDMHHGRIFNTAGDALLAEFTSPIEAVRCATDIQAALRTRNDQIPRQKQVRFRIGVNLGDVMMHGADLLGDGVNVAARLQGAAEPGGICISGTVYDQIRNKLSLNIESLGERRFKNIPQAVRTFTIAGSDDDGTPAARKKSSGGAGALFKSIGGALSGLSLSRGLLLKSGVAVLALLVLGGGYWAFTKIPRSTAHATVAPQVIALKAKASVKPVAKVASVTDLDALSASVLADAQTLQRPKREINALTDSSSQIAALTTQLHALGSKPEDKTKAQSLLDDMEKLAVAMAQKEATALARAGSLLGRDLAKVSPKLLPASAGTAITAAQDAKTKFDAALDAVQKAQKGNVALQATKEALAAYDAADKASDAASDAAAPAIIAARRKDLAVVVSAARNISENIVALSRVKKPWLLASHARKDAYETLTSNAASAQSEIAELDALERRGDAATSLKTINAIMSSAANIKARLGSLLVSSNAATTAFNQ